MSGPSHPFRWPLSIDAVWLVMPLFVVVVRTVLQPIPMEDYWWHLVMGRLVDATGVVPTSNLFLFTLPPDAPFYDQPWLAQWMMYLIAHYGGHVATVLVHTGLVLVAWTLLVVIARARGATPIVVGITAAFAHYISASTLMPRTQMFAYPLFVVLAGGLLWLGPRPELGRKQLTMLAVLAAATAFWANAHGTFVLAPVLTAGAAVGWVIDRLRRGEPVGRDGALFWGVAVVVIVMATMLSPGGLENLEYPFKILLATKGNQATVLEWSPPGLYFQGVLFYLALAVSIVVLALRRRDVSFVELAVFGVPALIAVMSVRGVLWWAMAAVLVVGPHLSRLRPAGERAEPRPAEGLVNLAIITSLVAIAACALPGGPLFRSVDPADLFGDGRLGDDGDAAVLSDLHPAGLVEPLRALKGRHLFHDQAVGGFLEWELTDGETPRPVAFIDQRLELVPMTLWEEYFSVCRVKGDWRAVVDKYGLDAYLVHPAEQAVLVGALQSSPNYRLVAQDRQWRLFVRR